MSEYIIEENILLYLKKDIIDFIVPFDVIEISNNALNGCTILETLTLPNQNITVNGNTLSYCPNLKYLTFNDKTYNILCVDGDIAIIDNKREMGDITLYKCQSITKIIDGVMLLEPCNIAGRKGYYAHGENAKDAIRDVNIKISSDSLKFNPLSLDEIITAERYRELTGACELGVKRWMKEHNLTDGLSVSELIPLLEVSNGYGVDKFLSLIKNNC